MQPQQPQPPRQGRDWSGHIVIVLLMLLLALAGVIVGAMQVQRLPTWWPWGTDNTNRVLEEVSPTPTPKSSPVATPLPVISQSSVCGIWLSRTSGKRYNFICQNQNFFELYEVGSDQGLTKVGSGTVNGDAIEVDFFSTIKRRSAKLKLTLSADGQKLEGTMQGNDPRESGWLTFQKISG